ncbi:MAG: hypothetical protein GX564_10880 [Oligosphaeraceae bacterium]|nr:hypothetical protein [Oligosphaeraceae bacterium]
MIISHFNRYFEKHGRKTYIVLGIIISLMFVVFVTPGDIFGGGNGPKGDFGKMYGKSLKRPLVMKKMAETYIGICLRYPQALGQDFGTEMLFHETLNRMRLLHEAQKTKVPEISDSEIAASIHANRLFQDNGKFSLEFFQRFTENFLQPRGLVAIDLDRIVKENIIIERMEEAVTADAKVDEQEVAGYVEKYTGKFTAFAMDEKKDSQPTEQDIEGFFANRKADIKIPDSKSALVASFVSADLLAKVTAGKADKSLLEQIEPQDSEVRQQFDAFKDSTYKNKDFESTKPQIVTTLRSRNVRRYLQNQAKDLMEKFRAPVQGESDSDRIARFRQEAEKAGAKIIPTGFLTSGDSIPGMPGKNDSLARAIRSLQHKGEVSEMAYSPAGMAVACLTEVQPTPVPSEINAEVREVIADLLLTERAQAFYQEHIASYASLAPTVKDRRELGKPRITEIQNDKTLSDEEKQTLMTSYQEELQEYVFPFFREEKRSFALVSFNPEKFLSDIVDSELDLEAGYKQRLDEYQKKQIRLAKLVQNTTGLDESGKAAKKAKLSAALEKIAAGTDFAALIKDYSDEQPSGEQPLLDLKNLDADLAAQVTDLEAGQVSGIIETADSYQLVKVLERNDGRTLEEVKDELISILRQEKSVQMAFDAALSFAGKISDIWWKESEQDSSFDAQAALAKLAQETAKAEYSTIPKVSRNATVNPQVGRDLELLEAVFNTSRTEPFTTAVKGTNASYLACLLEAEAPYLAAPEQDPASLNTLKSIYRRKVAMDACRKRAEAEAERISAALKENDGDFEKAAGQTTFTDLEAFGRFEPGDLQQKARVSDIGTAMQAVAKAEVNSLLPPLKTSNGYILLYLTGKSIPDDENSRSLMENVRNYLLQQNKQKALTSFYQRLEAESNTQLPEGLNDHNGR